MVYSELVSLLKNYLQNEETAFVANIPDIVKQAEARIYSQVRTPDQRFSFSSTVAAATFTTPAAFWEPLSLWITVSGAYVPLLQKQLSFIRTAYPSGTGQPAYYALSAATASGVTITLGPTPDGTYTYTLDYIGDPTSVVTASSTWISVNAPDALLYGSLLEGYIYMKGETDLREKFQARFDTAMAAVTKMCEGNQLMDEYRNPPIQVQG